MSRKKQKRPRTYARNRIKRYKEKMYESDSTYFLKLVVFVLLATFWIKLAQPIGWVGIPIGGLPVGMLIGLLLVKKFEKRQSDRKIWYAVLLVVTIVCYFVPAGVVI